MVMMLMAAVKMDMVNRDSCRGGDGSDMVWWQRGGVGCGDDGEMTRMVVRGVGGGGDVELETKVVVPAVKMIDGAKKLEREERKGRYVWLEERVRLLVSSPGASSTPSYSPGPSTPPSYSPGPSTPQSYSPGPLRNTECSNCKHLLEMITVLEATVEMYMHSEQHTLNSAALLHELTMTWENLVWSSLSFGM
nr:hypothetical protein [Tanacetum cinerariifolium]